MPCRKTTYRLTSASSRAVGFDSPGDDRINQMTQHPAEPNDRPLSKIRARKVVIVQTGQRRTPDATPISLVDEAKEPPTGTRRTQTPVVPRHASVWMHASRGAPSDHIICNMLFSLFALLYTAPCCVLRFFGLLPYSIATVLLQL